MMSGPAAADATEAGRDGGGSGPDRGEDDGSHRQQRRQLRPATMGASRASRGDEEDDHCVPAGNDGGDSIGNGRSNDRRESRGSDADPDAWSDNGSGGQPQQQQQQQRPQQQPQQQQQQRARPPPPLSTASLPSRWLFNWPRPLLQLGMSRPIEETDLPELEVEDTSDYNLGYVERMWEEEKRRCAAAEAEAAAAAPADRAEEAVPQEQATAETEGEHAAEAVGGADDDDADGGGVRKTRKGDKGRGRSFLRCCASSGMRSRSRRAGDDDKPPARRKQQQPPPHQHHPPRPSLPRAVLMDYLRTTWSVQIMVVTAMASRIGQAIALGLLIEQFTTSQEEEDVDGEASSGGTQPQHRNNAKMGYVWVGVLVVCGLIFFLGKQQVFFRTNRKGAQLRVGFVAAIYAKSLRLGSVGVVPSSSSGIAGIAGTGPGPGTSPGTGPGVTSGRVVNLASNDVERFLNTSIMLLFLIYGPLEAISVLVIGLNVIGPTFAAGFGLILIFVPAQFYFGKRFASLRLGVAAITDARVGLVSQAVSGARVMKMSCWERQFGERIDGIRDAEMSKILDASGYKSLNEAIHFVASVVASIVTFAAHVLAGGTLTSRNVWTTMSLMNIIQNSMMKLFSQGVMNASECYVSMTRIQNFLELPELPGLSSSSSSSSSSSRDSSSSSGAAAAAAADLPECHPDCPPENGKENSEPVVALSDATCYWNERVRSTMLPAALRDVTLRLRAGALHCVVGPVGSGKSALLRAIAGELPLYSGEIVRRRGRRACVGGGGGGGGGPSSFLAYAQQDPWIMDGTVRENILFGLPFDSDWYGTVVGACGLSVDMAAFPRGDATIVGDRGVQCSGGQRARIGLARALYRDAELLLLDDPLSAVDSGVGRRIYYSAIQDLGVMRGKCVVLVTHQHQFIGSSRCILMDDGKVKCKGSYSECVDASGGKLTASFQTSEGGDQVPGAMTTSSEAHESFCSEEVSSEEDGMPDANESNDDDHEETRTTGLVRLSTWKDYAGAMGGVWVGISMLILFGATQASALICIVFIGDWAQQPQHLQHSPSWLGLIFGLAFALAFLSLLRARLSFKLCIKASQRLHDRMTQSVLRAKIEFFDTNPLGRILNRFSADVGICDDLLPLTMYDFLVGTVLALGSVATALVALPFTLLALPPLVWFFIRSRRIFVTTSRELKRLEGLARSPIFAMIGEALSGVATIRTNEATDYFRQKFEAAHDAHTRAVFAFVASSRWFAIRMDTIAFTFVSFASLFAVLFHDQGWLNVNPAVLGLTITLLLQMAGTNFPWVVRLSAEVVNQMVSVERVSAFGRLPSEAALVTDYDDGIRSGWPKTSSITATNLTVRYRSSLPPALSGIAFNIKSGQRVGVVGRTGSGKSSLVQSLFRLLEAETGKIEVDGVDISKLGLRKVRTSMSVIPQSPVLFSGCNVRFNLDPFRSYDDGTLRAALADVQMLDAIDSLPEGLDSIVSDGGSNFSVGQRQLLSLARAILVKNSILVLDEPTANVDTRTDALLQQAVAKSFAGATIISVAHRLETVIENDLIIVLGEGQVLECGAPKELLSVQGGHFASMVDNTGDQMAKSLRRRALAG